MLKALKVAAGLVPKVSLSVAVDSHNAKHPGGGVDRGASFLSVGTATAAIRGSVTCLVHSSRPLAVSDFKIVFVTHVGIPQPQVKQTEEESSSLAYGRRLHEQEIVFWTDARDLSPGQHTFEFTIPFWGSMPNTAKSWRGLKGLDITHKLSAQCEFHWARGHHGLACANREVVIYRHMDEEGKAFLDGKWLYHATTQPGANAFCGEWNLRIVMQTHAALGDAIKLFFSVYVVKDHGRIIEAATDTLSCRLVESQEYTNGTKCVRSLGPPTPFSPLGGKTYITVDEDSGRVISFDKRSEGGGARGRREGTSRAYYSATLQTKQAQPRCTHELLSITHMVEFRVAPDFGGVLPGEAKLVLPVRLVYVPRTVVAAAMASSRQQRRAARGSVGGAGSSSSSSSGRGGGGGGGGSSRLTPSASSLSIVSLTSAAPCRPRCESLAAGPAAAAFGSVSSSSPGSSVSSLLASPPRRRRRPDLPPTFLESVTIARGGSQQQQQEWEAVEEYTPRMHDEIALQAGDLVRISPHGMFPDGWSRGTNLRTSESGVFPMANVVSTASRVDRRGGFAFSLTVPDDYDENSAYDLLDPADSDHDSLHLYLGSNRSIRGGSVGGGDHTDDEGPVEPPPNFGSLPPRYSASSTDLTALAAATAAAAAAAAADAERSGMLLLPQPPRYSRLGVPSPLGPGGGGPGGGSASGSTGVGRHLSHRLSAPEMTHLVTVLPPARQ
ncbi:hypothetical protein HDU87_008515 [Geranomyces variabilis]|uniref:SH3 domain-containing protein n=1 Tax=Geranomyces variabilis TaxID=109894 RepID=A0AAD5TTN3_9FUNG|nr:hypothetical protein HDU87_008515 [Geranomyces variabilis]